MPRDVNSPPPINPDKNIRRPLQEHFENKPDGDGNVKTVATDNNGELVKGAMSPDEIKKAEEAKAEADKKNSNNNK